MRDLVRKLGNSICSRLMAKKPRPKRRSTRRPLMLESFEPRLNLASFVGDFDGIAGTETVQLDPTLVTFTNTKTGINTKYSLNAWNDYQALDLDGKAGLELLLTNITSVNGVPQPSQATIVNLAKNEVRIFDVGAPNAKQVIDLDGIGGPEILFSNLRSSSNVQQPATAVVLSPTTNDVRRYDVGRPNAFQIADLDGVGGPEVLFTNINSVNGVPQPTQASVLSQSSKTVKFYDVGSSNAFQVADLDGVGGPEVLFTNIRTVNSISQPVTAVVLNPSVGTVNQYSVNSPNAVQVSELDGQSGNEVLFTNLSSVNGVPQSALATVVTQRSKQVRSFQIDATNAMQVTNLDGLAGNEVLFTNMRTVNGVPQTSVAQVLTMLNGTLTSYFVNNSSAMQVLDLDGNEGMELLFTNLSSVNNVPQPAQAIVISPRTKLMQTYNVGSPNAMQVADLDGAGGPELLFSNLRSINGVPQLATATVVSQTSKSMNNYAIGTPNSMELADLNGQAGNEVLFTNIRSISGVQQPVQASILIYASKQLQSFNVGSPNAYQLVDLDGLPGLDVLLTNVTIINGVPQNAIAFLISAVSNSSQQYSVGSPNALQIVDLDGLGSPEVLFTNVRTVNGIGQPAQATVVSFSSKKFNQYSVGSPTAMQTAALDGSDGYEVLFSNVRSVNGVGQPAEVNVLSQRTAQVSLYNVGSPNSMQLSDLDGQAGQELLFTNLRSVSGVPQAAEATVVTQRNKSKQTYGIGQPNAMQVTELDGQAGYEVLFTNLATLNGVPQLATAGILTQRNSKYKDYAVGRPTNMQVLDLDGIGASEVLFTNLQSVNGALQTVDLNVLSGTTQTVTTYQIASANSMQVADLDGLAGNELLFTNLSSINGTPQPARASVLSFRSRQLQAYDVGAAQSFSLQQLDGQDGSEVLFASPTVFRVLTYRLNDVYAYSVGGWTSFSISDLDGVAGDEIRIISSTGKQIFLNHRLRTLVKVT